MFRNVCWSINLAIPYPTRHHSLPGGAFRAIRTARVALQPVNELQTHVAAPSEDGSSKLLDEYIGQQRLQLREQRIPVSQHELCLIEPADVDAVMDMYISAGQEERDPYWARPWPSALALGRYILERPHCAQGRTVCEVGAGLGIASIAALLAGAEHATLTDREPLALECGLRSARASGIPGVAENLPFEHVTKLVSSPASSKVIAQIRAAFLDWSEDYTGPKFDLVLACDVLYEDFSVEPVGRLLPQLLSDNGQVLLADPSERTRHNREYFVDMMLSQTERPLLLEECLAVREEMDGKQHSVEILRFRFRQGSETVGVKTVRR